MLLLGLPLLVSACSGGGEKNGGEEHPSPDPNVSMKEPEPIALTFSDPGGMSTELFMENYGNAITKKFPHITVRFFPVNTKNAMNQRLMEPVIAGETLDIVSSTIGNLHASFLENKMGYDLTEMIKQHKIDLNKFPQEAIDLMRQFSDGGVYGLPYANTSMFLLYNKDIFDKFGVDYPKDGMTWDDVYELAKKTSRSVDGIHYRGFVTSFTHLALTNQLSAATIDPKTNKAAFASDPKWRKLAENFLRFYQIPGNEVTESTVSVSAQFNSFLLENTVAMYAAVAMPQPTTTMNWDIVGLPSFKELPGVSSQPYPSYFLITNMSKHKEEALRVIEYLTMSEEFLTERSSKGDLIALRSSVVKNNYGKDQPYLQGKNVAKARFPDKLAAPAPLTSLNAVAVNHFVANMNDLILGKTDINTALRLAAEQTDAAIKAAQAK